jgi:sigma-B regulation protein RsbU (phosphoserine phosphatase)
VLAKAVGDPYLFASMFVGVLDTDTFQLTYASAGHDAAYVRGNGEVVPLKVTGPVLGVMEEPFGTESFQLVSGDALVLATDGLTEVRNPAGEQLFDTGAMELIAKSGPDAQRLADDIVAKVRSWAGRSVRDDLAVLVVRVIGAQTPHA